MILHEITFISIPNQTKKTSVFSDVFLV